MCAGSHCAEIGDALNAFEQQRQQNSTLLGQLTERDAALNALKAEKLSVQQQLESANETVRTATSLLGCLCGSQCALSACQDFMRTACSAGYVVGAAALVKALVPCCPADPVCRVGCCSCLVRACV